MALVEKSGFSADHDDFLTFHTREKSRLAYADVRLLAWRVISCECERDGKNKVENIDLVGRVISCVCDGAVVGTGYLKRVCDTGRACDGAVKNEVKNFPLVDTGRACDGAGLTYANMVRRKG